MKELKALIRHWHRATEQERKEFLEFVAGKGETLSIEAELSDLKIPNRIWISRIDEFFGSVVASSVRDSMRRGRFPIYTNSGNQSQIDVPMLIRFLRGEPMLHGFLRRHYDDIEGEYKQLQAEPNGNRRNQYAISHTGKLMAIGPRLLKLVGVQEIDEPDEITDSGLW